ncbi:alpha-amylase [Hymenobacter oligotrophus]|uniref:Alpha-amylase n=1 Tax=Hymenobacter oligotrophus TaxID=2319843 RepID=A0A3B7R323_9BACT|nr:glycoside hydrolase family 13 protein [Hymenobacter oligotrophus]AYA37813.1 alpha-amylase [Hymenobacter oligotrophus]
MACFRLNSLLLGAALACSQFALGQGASASRSQPPAWAKEVVWYQIFVERFSNGDPKNDPTPETMQPAFVAPPGWRTTPWGRNWYEPEPWAKQANLSWGDELGLRRYGGDLQGVLNKLDYLRDLGVSALYFNPLNDAPSLHKYDARNYHHIDVTFGPDPAGDRRIIASENPADPSTWQWTSADKLFLKLVAEAHRRNMRVVLDYSWNHTGVGFWAWQDVLQKQKASPFSDWYQITAFDNPATPVNEFAYQGWANLASLPEIRKANLTTERKWGRPYEGNLSEGAKQHIYAVSKRWLAPDGDPSRGIDGYRLDVADQVPMGFWRDYRTYVKNIKPDAYLVGEIWWEEWPDKLMNPVPYVSGDIFDAVMFYQVYRPARNFFANVAEAIDAKQFVAELQAEWNRLAKPYRYAMMNVSATHDTPRLLTDFYNPGKYKYQATPRDNANYKTGKPDADTYQRVRLYLMHQFTNIGAPHIWNGDELGMWGADDPDCRKPLMWPEFKFEPEARNNYQPGAKAYDPVGYNAQHHAFYQKLARIRQANPVLRTGDIEFLTATGKQLAYRRFNQQEQIVVLFNLESISRAFKLPHKARWTNLLEGTVINSDQITLPPLTGIILKK